MLFDALKTFKQPTDEVWVVSNGLFDTTKGNLFQSGFHFRDFVKPVKEGMPESCDLASNEFLGDLDIPKLRDFILEKGGREKVYLVVLTLTNNNVGGQPVSMRNIKATKELCDEFNIPLLFDGCRINENAYFIQRYEDGYQGMDVRDILREMFTYCDGFYVSLKKVLCSMGAIM